MKYDKIIEENLDLKKDTEVLWGKYYIDDAQ